jgi:hypothetical protein
MARRLVFSGAAALVGLYYLWAVRASGTKFEWGYNLDGYYNYLARAFTGGHLYLPIQPKPELLAQPDPWDPAVDPSLKWHDMALYGGRYYLYFGAAPAVLFFAPWRLATGHDLPQNFAMFLICFGGFLFSCGALLRVLDLLRVKAGPLLLAVMLLALGLCQSVPYLLNRVAVYEIAIAGGYFCISAAVFFLARGLGSERATYWFAASGLMYGAAVACRPHLIVAGIIALAALAWKYRARRPLAGFTLGLALAGAAIGLYNYERFGNPLEFGFRYQLAGPGQNRVELSPRNVVPGMYFMLLSRPEWSPVFPWMRMVFRFPFDSAERYPLPRDYFLEPTVGALWLAPFLLAAVLLPRSRAWLWVTGASSVAILLFLISTHLATHRYEVDFVPLAVFTAVANLAAFVCRRSGWKRAVLSAIFAGLIGYSMAANLAMGIAGPYDDVLKDRPARYVRIAGWFSPLREYRPLMNPAIAVDLEARFTPEPAGFRDPLITIGHSHHNLFLYVEHRPYALRFVLVSEDGTATHELPDPGAAPVRVGLVFRPESHEVAVTVRGEPAMRQMVSMLVTAPAGVALGENFSDPGLTARRFTGELRTLRKDVGEARP